MDLDTLTKANYISSQIDRYERLVRSLKEDLEFLEQGHNKTPSTLSLDLRYSNYSSYDGRSTFNKTVKVKIPYPILLKITSSELYIANNLLNKYILELTKL